MVTEKGKYKKHAIEKGGQPFYVIVEGEGVEIKQVFAKPNFKEMDNPNLHCSGAHVIAANPERNHIDHWENGLEWKEYIPNERLDYWISGGRWGV